MSNFDFWGWTLLFVLLCIIFIKIFYMKCHMTDQERLYYTIQSKPLNKEPVVLYSINRQNIIKIDSENV